MTLRQDASLEREGFLDNCRGEACNGDQRMKNNKEPSLDGILSKAVKIAVDKKANAITNFNACLRREAMEESPARTYP